MGLNLRLYYSYMMFLRSTAILGFLFVALVPWSCAWGGTADQDAGTESGIDSNAGSNGSMERAAALVAEVTIYRDGYGVPHIWGGSDESVVFGFAYAQAEDIFWQVEDSYILALGRYSEVHGPRGLNSDLLNRAFEVVPRSREDFPKLDAKARSLCIAFTDGLNYFLAKHPSVRPRLIDHFEPWHVLAFWRQIQLEMSYRYTHLSDSYLPRNNSRIWAQVGSNGWAIAGSRTQSGGTMLFVNPHQPLFGFGQLYEAQLSGTEGRDGKPWNFTGATFPGSPLLTIGRNRYLGWTMTTNEPDIADVWEVRFSDTNDPLAYEYDGAWRRATEWRETIRIKSGQHIREEFYILRKTHHGPVVGKVDETTRLVARISGLYEVVPMRQSLPMMKARSLQEFRDALSLLQLSFMNIVYADIAGNIYYLYGARAPRRDPRFDWSKPVDGSDPRAEWLGVHGLDDLPQVVNPRSGFVQNCNSSPYITTDMGNPSPGEVPPYLVEDANEHKRRALRSLEMLRQMENISLDDLERAAFDTEVYWARHVMPQFLDEFEKVQVDAPEFAAELEPLVEHLKAWDCRVTADSTAATLCEAWYEAIYESDYPGENLKERYAKDPIRRLEALNLAAAKLERLHRTWKVPYGRLHRLQRRPDIADLFALRFDDRGTSLPYLGVYGPMGAILTQYYTPSIHIPLITSQKKRYGVVGTTYMAIYEFGPDGGMGRSVVPFGTSGDPRSTHYFDQAELLAACRMKPIPFTLAEVQAATVLAYHPGEEETIPKSID
ncbi:MAG: penicillin acylase family protein [Pirellulales bacterium]|nr:penicillin acylase family protein [Pirellulales bacterium]